LRLAGSGLFSAYTLEDLRSIACKLLAKLPDRENPELEYGRHDHRPRIFYNARLFLVSANPALLLVVPHQFKLDQRNQKMRQLFLFADVQEEYRRQLWPQAAKQGLTFLYADLSESYVNWLELSSVFPNAEGIVVLSDLWDGALPLQQALVSDGVNLSIRPAGSDSSFIEVYAERNR
jgi:hypothetical protein